MTHQVLILRQNGMTDFDLYDEMKEYVSENLAISVDRQEVNGYDDVIFEIWATMTGSDYNIRNFEYGNYMDDVYVFATDINGNSVNVDYRLFLSNYFSYENLDETMIEDECFTQDEDYDYDDSFIDSDCKWDDIFVDN